MEEADIRCADDVGDFAGASITLVCGLTASISGSRTGVSSTAALTFGPLGVSGVEADEDGRS